VTQADLNYVASNLNVHYDVVDNLIDTWLQYKARVTLTNKGDRAISRGDWAIYFCSIRIIEPEHLSFNPQGYIVPEGPGIKLTHINGCLHKMEPTEEFKDLGPDSNVQVEFKVKYFAVARTDIMPNWYVAATGLEAKTINNTIGEGLGFVGDFNTEKQWKRYTGDRYHPYTPEQRYDDIEVNDLGSSPLLLIPTPLYVSGWNKTQRMTLVKTSWTMSVGIGLKNEASYLVGETTY
jgi:hexosaminidase